MPGTHKYALCQVRIVKIVKKECRGFPVWEREKLILPVLSEANQ